MKCGNLEMNYNHNKIWITIIYKIKHLSIRDNFSIQVSFFAQVYIHKTPRSLTFLISIFLGQMCSWYIMTPSKVFLWGTSHHKWHIFSSNGLFWWWVMKDLNLQLLQWVKILKINFGLVEKYWLWCILEIMDEILDTTNGWWQVLKTMWMKAKHLCHNKMVKHYCI